MEIVNRRVLERAAAKNAALRVPMQRWAEIVADAEWYSLQEVRETFPSADGVTLKSGTVATVFNVGGNNYRIVAVIFYQTQRVYVAEVLTHAKYNKNQWKEKL